LRERAPGSAPELYPFKLGALSETLEEQRKAAFKALINGITSPKPDVSGPSTQSGTYGTNDPLTLSFLSEILLSSDSGTEQVRILAKREAKRLRGYDPAKQILEFFKYPLPAAGEKKNTSTPLTNAFIPLRVIRACRQVLDDCDSEQKPTIFGTSRARFTISFPIQQYPTAASIRLS
jgi:hypothetical protein